MASYDEWAIRVLHIEIHEFSEQLNGTKQYFEWKTFINHVWRKSLHVFLLASAGLLYSFG